MIELKMSSLYSGAIFLIVSMGLFGCATPSTVHLPNATVVAQRSIELHDISQLPLPRAQVMAGDTLRIIRDAEDRDEHLASDIVVRSDGTFSYPYAGTLSVMGHTLEEIAAELTKRLRPVYRQPQVTINIVSSPSNRVFVGGAVRNAASFELGAINTIEQAIISAGGVLPSADSKHIALLRKNEKGVYQVYFTNYSQLLKPEQNSRSVQLVRGDIVFVPKSAIGNAVEGVDLYINQLLPFSRSIGLGFTHILRQPNSIIQVQ